MQQKINTISCPCSSYAITNTNGAVSCERDNFGKIEYVAPVVLQNHLINGSAPAVGDKWSCGGAIKCGSTGFSWNTLHVVSVSDNYAESNSSLVNTTSSTSNCYVPKSSLRDYESGEELSDNWDSYASKFVTTFNMDIVKTVGDTVAFDNEDAARMYGGSKFGSGTDEVSSYYDNNTLVFAPGKYYGDNSLITGITINGRKILDKIIDSEFKYKTQETSINKVVIPSEGGVLEIKIEGENTPTIDMYVDDSSGCSVFKRRKKDEAVVAGYTMRQIIPALSKGKTKETYDIKISPRAGTTYRSNGRNVGTGSIEYKVWQFKDPTITFDTNNSTIANTTTTSTQSAVTGKANTRTSDTFAPIIHTTTIAVSGENSNIYYNNKGKLTLSDLITDSSVINKTLLESTVDPVEVYQIQISSDDDISIGMQFTGSYNETKTLQKSVDLDPIKEPCDNCDEELDILTNKFDFENTNNLVKGMMVTCVDSSGSDVLVEIESVDSGVGITLSEHLILDQKTEVKFTWTRGGYVTDIQGSTISCDAPVWFPKSTELAFTKGAANKGISGSVAVDKSGASTIVVTAKINSIRFDQSDVDFVLDVNEFISLTPESKDIKVESNKDDFAVIDYFSGDEDYNVVDKTVEVISQPRNGVLDVISENYARYYPNKGFTGADEIVFASFTGTGDGKVYGNRQKISIKIK